MSEMKRDLAQTGNKRLRDSTLRALREKNSLQTLRTRMGVSATGFQSRNCE